MTIGRFFSPLAALCCTLGAIAVMLVAASEGAMAQATCTTYLVDIDPGVPACAFPLRVTTKWGALVHTTQHAMPGQTMVGNPNPPGVWIPPFTWVSLNGGNPPQVPLGGVAVMRATGCTGCLRVEVALTPAGCIHIKIAPHPGPC